MALPAYTSLASLTQVLDNLHYRAQFHLPHIDINQIKMLQENVHFLLRFVELHSKKKNPEIVDLWGQMAEIAFEVEDKIDFHVVNQLHMRSKGETFSGTDLSTFCKDMEIWISRTDSIKQEIMFSINEEGEDVQAGYRPSRSSSAIPSSGKNDAVGIDEHVERIMYELTGDKSNFQILPIVGMAGIGKTTLAKTVFSRPYIVNYFDIRVWSNISQEPHVEKILIDLLDEEENLGENRVQLGERLYEKLFDRKYLIILDDVWSIEIWNHLRRYFPKNGIGRIVLTTRLLDVASRLGSLNPYSLTFLDEDRSWELFCVTTFEQIGCPYEELEGVGKDIAKGCRGLPMEIVVIGRLLANSNMTREYWKSIAQSISSFGNLEDDEHCLKTLYLSYGDLPIHLKPCFLYMRKFPEDAKIDIFKLIRLWVDEGFIKTSIEKSVEQIGKEYLEDLVQRNLVFVNEWTIGGEMSRCSIHDLFRDLCLREFEKEHFIFYPKVQKFVFGSQYSQCFLCSNSATKITSSEHVLVSSSSSEHVHVSSSSSEHVLVSSSSSEHVPVSSSTSQINPIVCNSCVTMRSGQTFVRALCGAEHFVNRDLVQPTKLCHFSTMLPYDLDFVSPSVMLPLLWNLHTVDVHLLFAKIVIPSAIWEMPQLRHLEFFNEAILTDPSITHTEGKDICTLINLQRLSLISNFNCTEEVVRRIPNLKELRTIYDGESWGRTLAKYSLYNLVKFEGLEKLVLRNARVNMAFPTSLKKLRLIECRIHWLEMTNIGRLPCLEELELHHSTKGGVWDPVEGEFRQLKGLYIQDLELVQWRADQVHFPNLEWLHLVALTSLEEIPLSIGDIETLHTIKIKSCSDSVVSSANEIWNEQQDNGNETLQIHVIDHENRREYIVGAFEEQTS